MNDEDQAPPVERTAPPAGGSAYAVAGSAYAADKAAAFPARLDDLREGRQPYPVHLHLIPSDLCNLACPGCAYRMPGYSSNERFGVVDPLTHAIDNNPNRMLPWTLLEQVLDDCVDMGVQAIEVTGGGEPTIHPQIEELIEGILIRGISAALITNGIMLHRKPRLLDLAARCTWARISIDAASRETYGLVRPGLGGPRGENFDTAIQNLGALRRQRDTIRSDCTIGAGFVVQRENFRELYDAVRIFREVGADNVRISGLFSTAGDRYFDGWKEEAVALERQAIVDFDGIDAGRFRVYGRLHEKIDDLAARPSHGPCYYQHFTTYLGADQNLYRCCVTSYSGHGLIGSVATDGLKALWDSAMKRDRFHGFDANSCGRCQFNDRNRAIRALVAAPGRPDDARKLPIVHAAFV